ncbi:MAG: ATP-dependent DNA helicase RecG [Candidatus Omnitrophica bacterium]|nr:ATP-dependent DNA helicase RecG [Candidatus Omnitrophota bacterium]
MQDKNVSTSPLRTGDGLKIPVQYIKGVGPKRADLLKQMALHTAEDILYNLPRRYEDRSNFTPISKVTSGQRHTLKGQVLTFGLKKTKRGISVFQVAIGDNTGVIYAMWFNQPFVKKYFKVGQKIILYGKVDMYDVLVINQPEYEILDDNDDGEDSAHIGRIVPIYPLTKEVAQKFIRALTKKVVEDYNRFLHDTLPTKIRAKNKLVDIRFAINNIHFPTNNENLKRAYQRVVFEEFFILQCAIALRKKDVKTEEGLSHRVEGELMESFKKSIPFELTKGQAEAIRHIENDMKDPKPMNRLLEGDVGSGKTIVATYALVLTVQNGFQGTIMVPTEILAEQHYLNLSKILVPLGINVSLLIRSIPDSAKEKIKQQIKDGDADIVVGTHALIQEAIEFKRLGLCVIDEQHKFGVTQRDVLRRKGKKPDVLVMTATPIPRTLALTVYGDLDISIIRELPPGRRPISTYWVEDDEREKVYKFVGEQVKLGRQAYIVYPRIHESKSSEVLAATQMYDRLKDEVFKDFKVGLMHGQIDGAEKDKIMTDFKKGEINILISTVVIEVGIDVPNASVMVIENAERFGLAQLHQLRGRVGRGEHDSYCILLSNPTTKDAKKRLEALTETVDGFAIAEEDLELRGPGEFFGTRQHGLPEIRFGNIVSDMEIMEQARKEAFELIHRDPGLNAPENKLLKEILYSRFKGRAGLIHVG